MKTTFVLVHGAWHGAWVWDAVAPRLRARGFEVVTPEFATDNIGLSHHIGQLVDCIDAAPGDLVLVGHSYGGMVITGAAAARASRIARLVYLDALVPADGQSVATLAGSPLTEGAIANANQQGDGWRVSGAFFPPAKFVDWQGERLERFCAHLTPQPLRTFLEPIRLEKPPTAVADFVLCTQDPLGVFDPIAAARRKMPGWSVFELPTRHDAMLLMPDVVTAIVARETPGDVC